MSPTTANLRGGIDLGGTKIQTVVVNSRNQVKGQSRAPTPTEGKPEDVAKAMAACMKEAVTDAGVAPTDLVGVGVGSPGDANEQTGVVQAAKNLPGWEGSFPLADWLSKELGPPVRIGNDVQAAVDAEFALGAGKPYRTILGVFWGTGVGGGLILDGKPWLGRGAAAEIGHMVIKEGGARCTCGRKGCMEAYAGRAAMELKARREVKQGAKTDLFKIMKERDRPRLTSGVWARALKHDDKLAKHLIDRAIHALAVGIASAANLLDPEAIILGGGMGIRFGDEYMDTLQKRMLKHLFTDTDPAPMHVAALGDLGGAIGAALLAKPKRSARSASSAAPAAPPVAAPAPRPAPPVASHGAF
ncbi:MAG: ROK family protein [Solirubrobacterales bacterium]|nr:ROK family protein [Solirubrobacterales bacterium]